MNLTHSFFAVLAFAAVETAASAGTVALVPVADNTIYSESGTTSNGSGDFLFAGRVAIGPVRRALVRFDVASAIPAGSTIVSAQLSMTMSQSIAGPVPVRLHRALASWGEGASDAPGQEGQGAPAQTGDATWTQRFFGGSAWTTLGGDFTAQPSATTLVDQFQTWTWGSTNEMVDDVQLWLNQPAQNAGWIVIGDESTTGTAKRFDSRSNPSLQGPVLMIDFTAPCATANYCTATPNSTGLPGHLALQGGTASLALGTQQLVASNLPATTSCTFFFGSAHTETPLGNGNLCVTGSVFRLGTSTASGGVATRNIVYGSAPASVITPFSTWCFQGQYRNAAAGGAGFNQTDGLAITFCP